MQFILAPHRPASFRRTVQDDDTLSVVYTFEAGVPIDVPEHHLAALRQDIGHAIVVPKEGKRIPDWDATKEAVELIDAIATPSPKKRKHE